MLTLAYSAAAALALAGAARIALHVYNLEHRYRRDTERHNNWTIEEWWNK